jgi:radical SAM superfamily enzyme YgiQ (UPF0313 family)
MKILLISPNTLTVPYPVYPLGLDYVAASVSPEHQVRTVDMNVLSMDELFTNLQEYQPDITGISCRNIDNTEAGNPLFFIHQYRDLVSRIREKSRTLIVCGGAGFTILANEIFRELDADYGIIGEGERFGLLVDGLAQGNKEAIAGIPGLLTRDRAAVKPEAWQGRTGRRVRENADRFSFYLQRGGMLNLQSKRGCRFNCIYCPYPHIEGRKHRLFAPEQVAATALALQDAGARYFFITDSAFNSDIDHSLAVAAALEKAGITIPWGAFFSPIKLPPDYFARMAAAGLSHVEFGTESLSQQMLQTYRKPFQREQVFAAHDQALTAGIHVAHYFLMGGPGETEATVQESLEQIEQLKKAVFFFFIGIRIYPHTAIHTIALDRGKILPDTSLLKPVFYLPHAIEPAAIEQLVQQQARARQNWLVGSGGSTAAAIVERMYAKGYTGPLWEYLI